MLEDRKSYAVRLGDSTNCTILEAGMEMYQSGPQFFVQLQRLWLAESLQLLNPLGSASVF